MRGKGTRAPKGAIPHRITPAHAGKSDVIASGKRVVGDHPRPCGEKYAYAENESEGKGSPPPMRGKVFLDVAGPVLTGITPAHAGKSRRFAASRGRAWDHPRPCGEKLKPVKKPV